MRSLSKHSVTPNFWGFNFRFLWFSRFLQKKILKKLKKRIYRNKGHFRALHMLLDVCRKNEGDPFFTKIGVVGSYTDTLLTPRSGLLPCRIVFQTSSQFSVFVFEQNTSVMLLLISFCLLFIYPRFDQTRQRLQFSN